MSLGRNCSNWNKVTVYCRVDIRGAARRDAAGSGRTRRHAHTLRTQYLMAQVKFNDKREKKNHFTISKVLVFLFCFLLLHRFK